MSSVATKPIYTNLLDARELGLRFAAERRRLGLLLLLVSLVLIVGSAAGFAYYGHRNTSLAKNGVHTTATVTSAVRRDLRPERVQPARSTSRSRLLAD